MQELHDVIQVIYSFDSCTDEDVKKELKKYILAQLKRINGGK